MAVKYKDTGGRLRKVHGKRQWTVGDHGGGGAARVPGEATIPVSNKRHIRVVLEVAHPNPNWSEIVTNLQQAL